MSDVNYYKILGVKKSSTIEEIMKIYKKLALKYHSNKNKTSFAHDKFCKINEAYVFLLKNHKPTKQRTSRKPRKTQMTKKKIIKKTTKKVFLKKFERLFKDFIKVVEENAKSLRIKFEKKVKESEKEELFEKSEEDSKEIVEEKKSAKKKKFNL
ncbi:8480_t:CDS:2 [Cetraspora pellucida]|uniref:8480_t:CDS:1 n=1 Tax=Cetraspora pellucida TaxID=1433469 RepID=A0ACA9LNF4_9GLOM|nr:8480_t:CDS:2 [Cetraspora pellucida]